MADTPDSLSAVQEDLSLTMSRRVAAVLLTTVALGAGGLPASAASAGSAAPGVGQLRSFNPRPGSERPDARMRPARAVPASTTQVVVRYRHAVDLPHRAQLRRAVAARVTRPLSGLGVDLLTVPDAAAAAARLSASPDVLYAEPVRYATRSASYDPDPAPERTELDLPDAATQPAATGAGQTVAVLDDGVDGTNPDLTGRVSDGGYFTAEGVRRPTGGVFSRPMTGSPHGTAVAAVVAAAQDGQGVQGVVPQAAVASYRVFPVGAEGASSTAIAAALHALADDAAGNPALRVANLSLGFDVDTRVVRDAVAYAQRTAPQLTIVVAAGNDYGLRPSYPAGYPGVLSVGASGDEDDAGRRTGLWRQTDFSTKGDVDVLAPGLHVETWYQPDECEDAPSQQADGRAVCQVSGTSFAAPQVAGMAAQLAAAGVTGPAARTAIKASARPAHRSSQPAAGDGSGRADAAAALALATGSTPYAAVFLDGGEVLGAVTDQRRYEAVRVDPGEGRTSELPSVLASTGGVTTTAEDLSQPGLAVRRGIFSAPSTDVAALRNASLTVRAPGAADAVVPVAVVPSAAGDRGVAAVDRASYRFTTGDGTGPAGWSFDAYTVSAWVAKGASFTVTVHYPDDPGSFLYLKKPAADGGVAGFQAEDSWSLGDDREVDAGGYTPDTCVRELPRSPGVHHCTLKATVTGRYAVSLSNGLDGAPYSLSLDYSTPSATVSVPAVLSSAGTSTSIPVTWRSSGTDSSPGVRYDLDVARRTQAAPTGTTWSRWRTGTTATSGAYPGTAGQDYLFRVRRISTNGNRSAWSGASRSVVPYDERTSRASYSGRWTQATVAGRWGRGLASARQAGSAVALRAKGYRFAVVGDRCVGCGQVKVYLDGHYRATVDTEASGSQARKVLWTSGSLSGGSGRTHTVTLVVAGTPGRAAVRLDAFAVYR